MGSSLSVPLSFRALKCWLEGSSTLKVLITSKDDPKVLKTASIDLDKYIGVKDGKFDTTGSGFSSKASDIYLENIFLHAVFKMDDGTLSICVLNLNLFVAVSDDDLVFAKASTNIGDSCTSFIVEGSVYSALCLAAYGSLQDSSVNLNEKLGNKNGKFVTGSSKFSHTARDIHLDETGLILCAQLENYDGDYVDATFDLSTIYANKNGVLKYESPDAALDRDGIVTQFIETVPYVGWVAVAGHLRANNGDHAKRAMARTVYSTIVFAAATTGAIMGGPIGLAIGATAGTVVGMAAEGIIRTTVTSEEVHDDLDDINLKRFVKESLINTISGAAGSQLGKYAGSWYLRTAGKSMVDKVLAKVQARLVEEGVDKVSGQVFTTSSTYAVQAIEEFVADPNAEV